MADFQPSSENNSVGISLYKGINTETYIPQNLKIPPNEGLQVQVAGSHDATDNPMQVLQRFLLGLGSAKVIAESTTTQDFWANTRIENGQEVHAYGRVPTEDNSWRKPVDTLKRNATMAHLDSHYDTQKLQKLFRSYLPKWEELGKHIVLFEQGINGTDHEVTAENIFDTPIWTNGRIKVSIMQQKDPLTGPWLHLNGFHFVISPTEKFQRQWQTVTENDDIAGLVRDVTTGKDTVDESKKKMVQEYIQLTLEGAAVSLGIRELLAQGKGEIHNSGNWATGLKSTEEFQDTNNPEKGRGKLDLKSAAENIKQEKRKHFTRITIDTEGKPKVKKESDFNTATHFHLYIPFGEGPVTLPPMWPWEAQTKLDEAKTTNETTDTYEGIIKQWLDIKPLTPEQIQEAGAKIGNGNLTQWLQVHCQGSLQ